MARDRSRSPRRASQGANSSLPLADFLLQRGILDGKSVDFLKKAPIDFAGEVLLSLGPEVRNPSAFVTKRLAPVLANIKETEHENASDSGAPVKVTPPWNPEAETFTVYHKGHEHILQWNSQQEAVSNLVTWGILDEGSADFLLKAGEAEAKEIVSTLGPDVRNPSAMVTRRMKELRSAHYAEATDAAEATRQAKTLSIHHNGHALELQWFSAEQALGQLVTWGVLDEKSADFLGKVPEEVVLDILSGLGPTVKNPSAFVTRRVKTLLAGSNGMADAVPITTLTIHFNGVAWDLQWFSAEQALGQLVNWGVLDEQSADFLWKVPEETAMNIVSSLGPSVKNPSAFVTRKVKTLLTGSAEAAEGAPGTTLTIHSNGVAWDLQWFSAEQALGQLVSWGVLDEKSADFLGKVPEGAAIDILKSLGPDVQNPSAFVTRKVKMLLAN